MVTEKETSISQMALSILFMIVMLSGFISVAVISEVYETENVSELLYETNTDTEFLTIERTGYPFLNYELMSTGKFYNTFSPTTFHNITKIPVYTGNNTWGFSSNYSNVRCYSQYVIELPNLPSWLIHSINITTTHPGDSDMLAAARIISVKNTGIVNYIDDVSQVNAIYSSNAIESAPTSIFEMDIDIPLSQSLDIYSTANEKVQHMLVFQIIDEDFDGMTDFAFNINVEIHGEVLTGWTVTDSITVSNIFFGTLAILTGIMALDEFDIGGYVRNLPKKKRGV